MDQTRSEVVVNKRKPRCCHPLRRGFGPIFGYGRHGNPRIICVASRDASCTDSRQTPWPLQSHSWHGVRRELVQPARREATDYGGPKLGVRSTDGAQNLDTGVKRVAKRRHSLLAFWRESAQPACIAPGRLGRPGCQIYNRAEQHGGWGGQEELQDTLVRRARGLALQDVYPSNHSAHARRRQLAF